MIDILLNLNTGFYLKGELVENHWEIMQTYVKTRFLIDIIATIPIIIYLFILIYKRK